MLLDTSERAHVMDVKSQTELEVIDLSWVGLVYSSSFFKGMPTGGNVSEALVGKVDILDYFAVKQTKCTEYKICDAMFYTPTVSENFLATLIFITLLDFFVNKLPIYPAGTTVLVTLWLSHCACPLLEETE